MAVGERANAGRCDRSGSGLSLLESACLLVDAMRELAGVAEAEAGLELHRSFCIAFDMAFGECPLEICDSDP